FGLGGAPLEWRPQALPPQYRAHPGTHHARDSILLEDVLGAAEAAAVAVDDEVPEHVGSLVDEARPLRIAALDRRQRIQRHAQFPAEAADGGRLLPEDLVFEDVESGFRAPHETIVSSPAPPAMCHVGAPHAAVALM